jgi:hypothetical protein
MKLAHQGGSSTILVRTHSNRHNPAIYGQPGPSLRFFWPQVKGFTFSHFLRLEQRLLWLKKPVDNFNTTVRARYQLGIVSPTYYILFDNGIYLMGAVELFWDMKKSFTDNFKTRIRSHVGVGSRITDDWRVELQYVVQDGRSLAQDSFTLDERILRLRLFYNFNRYLGTD